MEDVLLTNLHRQYFGLKLIEDTWQIKIMEKNNEKYYLFFAGAKLVKIIAVFQSNDCFYLREDDVDYETKDNKTIILPKTKRGHTRPLNNSVIKTLNGEGVYFSINNYYNNETVITIGNYTTQRTFLEEKTNFKKIEDVRKWADNYVKTATLADLEEIEQFKMAKRKLIKFQKGDYFRVKLGRNLYTYGRVLLDISQEKNLDYWSIFPGNSVIIEIFHILSSKKDVQIAELKKLKTFPSQHVFDNRLYYGDWEIIGHEDLTGDLKYPVMYGQNIDNRHDDIIIFQCGFVHKQIPFALEKLYEEETNPLIYGRKYLNNSIGYGLALDKDIIEKCINANSNEPYWSCHKYGVDNDLRNPSNRAVLKKILKNLDCEYLLKIYENL